MIEENEARGIYSWLKSNALCLNTWPANVLFRRLQEMFADNRIDEEESGELLGLLMQIAAPDGRAGSVAPTTLPLTSPAPEIVFQGKSFCFTGVFEFGSRAECHHAVITKGGEPAKGDHEEARLPDHRFRGIRILAALQLWDEDHEGGAVSG